MTAVIALAVALLSLNQPPPSGHKQRPSSRICGIQPRGNAVLRSARKGKKAMIVVDTPQQTDRLRAAAMQEFGLNLNDYWTLRSGTIAEALPSTCESKAEAAELMQRKQVQELLDHKRLQAERRLRAAVRNEPRYSMREGDTRIRGLRPRQRAAGARGKCFGLGGVREMRPGSTASASGRARLRHGCRSSPWWLR